MKLLLFVGLFFISTVYLFSQTEETKLIEGDTVIRIDTIQIEKADTTMVEESAVDTVVLVEPKSGQDKKNDFIKHDFYNDYLPSLQPKDTLTLKPKKPKDTITLKPKDTILLEDCKSTNIFAIRIGGGIFSMTLSATWDFKVTCNTNIAAILAVNMGGMDGNKFGMNFFGLGLGLVPVKIDHFLIKTRICPGYVLHTEGQFLGRKTTKGIGFNMGIDMLLLLNSFGFSIGIDIYTFSGDFYPMLSIGLNIL